MHLQINEHITEDARSQAPDNYVMVLHLLTKVDEDEAQIAVMHFVEGMFSEEISEVTGHSRRTVAKRLDKFCRRAPRGNASTTDVAVDASEQVAKAFKRKI